MQLLFKMSKNFMILIPTFLSVAFPCMLGLSQEDVSEKKSSLEIRQPVDRPAQVSPEKILLDDESEEANPGERASLSPVEEVRVDQLNREVNSSPSNGTTPLEKDIEEEAFVRNAGFNF